MTCTYIVRLERAGTLFGNKSSDTLCILGGHGSVHQLATLHEPVTHPQDVERYQCRDQWIEDSPSGKGGYSDPDKNSGRGKNIGQQMPSLKL